MASVSASVMACILSATTDNARNRRSREGRCPVLTVATPVPECHGRFGSSPRPVRTSDEDKEHQMQEVRELEIEVVGEEELPEFALMVDIPDDD
ncbi:hypothetical protein GCM10010214_04630 [Streptomyces abikoensis]|nr:hypothetical protein GCM10010214_04630 [Streptomyces abikoensis]